MLLLFLSGVKHFCFFINDFFFLEMKYFLQTFNI